MTDVEPLDLPPEQRKKFYFQPKWRMCERLAERIHINGWPVEERIPGTDFVITKSVSPGLLEWMGAHSKEWWPVEMQARCWMWTAVKGKETKRRVYWGKNHVGVPQKKIMQVPPKAGIYTPWDRKSTSAARLAYEMFVTPLETAFLNGEWVRVQGVVHRCDPLCINPLHQDVRNVTVRNMPPMRVKDIFIEHDHDLEVRELASMIEAWVGVSGMPESMKALRERYGDVYTVMEIEAALKLLGERFAHLIS